MASNTSGTAVIKAATSYKKKPGTLQVMPDALLWTNKIDPNSTVSIKFSSIKAQFMSAATAKKVMLKISASIGSKDEDYTFTFTSNSATEERETVKDIIVNHLSSRKPSSAPATPLSSSGNPSAPATSQSSRPGTTSVVKLNQEFQLRDALLKQHKSLKRLHQELVLGGHVTEEEFWESRKHLIETQALRSGQKPGYSSAQMAGVQPTRSEGTDVKYTLTPQIIHSIFLQYPSIKKAYEDNVPDKISEQEFWRRYFSSQFFHRTRMQSRSTKIEGKDDIFDKCMQMEEDALLPSSKRMKLDAIHKTLNLEATAGDRVEESGNAPDKTMQHEKSSLPIIRRFNRQSEILLKEILKTSEKDPSSIDGQATAEKEILIEDLVPSQENNQLPLNIEDQSRYFDTTTSADAVNGALSTTELVQELNKTVKIWEPDLTVDSLKLNVIEVVERELTAIVAEKVAISSNLQTSESTLPTDIYQEVTSTHSSANELLRHFWASKASHNKSKEHRMMEALRKLRTERLKRVKDKMAAYTGPQRDSLIGLLDSLELSLSKALQPHKSE